MSEECPTNAVDRLRIPSHPKELEAALLMKEIRELFEQFKRELPRKRGQWPESIRSRVIALWRMGVTSHQIALDAHVPTQTLYSWRQRLKKSGFSEIPVIRHRRRTRFEQGLDREKADRSRSLQPLEKAEATTEDKKPITVSVITSDGIRIEGVPADQVVALVLELRQ